MSGKYKIAIAFGISVFAGLGYLGYRYARKRGMIGYTVNNVKVGSTFKATEADVDRLKNALQSTSMEFVLLVKDFVDAKKGSRPEEADSLKTKIEAHKDYEKDEVKQSLGLTMFN